MTGRENNVSVEKEKVSKKKIIIAVVVVLILGIAIFAVAKVYNSPARQLEKQLNLGNRYLEEMDYEQAIVAFDKAIEIDPKNVDAYLGKADAYIRLGDSAMAIETLETGYQAIGEDEAIANRLLDLYVEMTEDAIEMGSYEEGMKAYERIVELGGEEEELCKKLEELQDDENEEEDIVQVDEQEEEELPYYELGFSPEDFTLAGYSVMDGDHALDISQAMDKIMPENPYDTGENLPDDYTGWQWSSWGNQGLYVEYIYEGVELIVGTPISYSVGLEDGSIILEIEDFYALYEEYNWPTDVLSERPLFEAKVTIDVSSYEEVTNILGIQEIMQKINEQEKLIRPGYVYDEELEEYVKSMQEYSVFSFKSQYGRTECHCSYHKNNLINLCDFLTEEWHLRLGFYDDGILHSIRVERL